MQFRNNLPAPAAESGKAGGKGLERNALSFLSSAVIGISSTAPAYSLASALGTIAGIAAFGAPAVIAIAFVPMMCIATAYFYLNRADPDCGTTFAWVTRTMGPHVGWIGGWAVIVTNIIVMPSLAVIAGQYSFYLFGYSHPSTLYVTLAGMAWIAIMTAICYAGIEASARTQQILLGIELVILLIFAVTALVKVNNGEAPAHAPRDAAAWLNPLGAVGFDQFTEALLAAIFIYWGWDTAVSVNEETENPETTPGYAAVASTVLLAGLYVLVAVAALAFAGPALLSQNKDDIFAPVGESVLGPYLDKLLVVAVLTSASAATQTTIIPAARTALSMASAGALPKRFAEIHPRYLSPAFATLVMGGISLAWYGALSLFSKSVLADTILALGLCIAFYYALTGFACLLWYRRELLKSVRNFLLMGAIPLFGTLVMVFVFVRSCFILAATGSAVIFGIGMPLVIGLGSLLAGCLLMLLAEFNSPAFFRGRPETGRP